MKSNGANLLLLIFLLGCSKNEPKKETKTEVERAPVKSKPTTPPLPFKVTVAETPETKEIKDIQRQAQALLIEKNYDQLDALAKKHRDSKESYADGRWKLGYVYEGVNLPRDASEADWEQQFAALKGWITARPNSITARVAMAANLCSFAWGARGSGDVNTVSDSGWKLFFARLHQAVDVLKAAKSLKEQCPYWWSVLLRTELGLQTERTPYDLNFQAAIKAWPDFTPYYFQRATYLLPRWSGTQGEWEADLQKSAERIGGKDGEVVYARVVWDIHQSISSTNIFKEFKLSWDRVNAGINVIDEHFPNSLAVKNEGARLAVLARDRPTAKKYFGEANGQVDVDCWTSMDNFIRFAHWAYKEP